MKKILLLTLIANCFFLATKAQVSSYTFSQTSGTYTSLPAPTTPGFGATGWDDNVATYTFPAGFAFAFNGVAYTSCSVNTNGYITFGTTASGATGYSPISATTGYAGALAAFGGDLGSNGNSGNTIAYQVLGASPNRQIVFQWTNAQRYTGTTLRNGTYSFQIVLNETTNVLQVVYGPTSGTTYATDVPLQVGLRGASNADYNNRTTVNNWPASTAGGANTATCNTGTGAGEGPVSGLIYTWAPVTVSSTSPTSACVGAAVTLTGTNFTGATLVKFNGTTSPFTIVNATTITTTVPVGATTGPITVTTPRGVGTSPSFTVNTNATISLTSAAATTSQNICSTQPIANITYAIGGGATNATATGLPAGTSGTLAGGVFTISGTPTAIGTFNYTVNTVGPCATPSLGGTITVAQSGTVTLSSAAGTNAQVKCINTPITTITYTIGGTSTGATVTGLPATLSAVYSAGTLTISGTPTAAGTINYTVVTSGSSCINPTATGTITVNADATVGLTSASGTDAQIGCQNAPITNITYGIGGGGTGATVTGLPAGVGFAYAGGVLTISGTPTGFGSFNYTVQTTGPCVTPTAGGTLTINQSGTISLSSGVNSNTPTLCINTGLTSITYNIGGTATGATLTGSLPVGVSGVYSAGVFTISGTPTSSGVFAYTVTTTGSGCTNPALSGSITVNANATNTLTSPAGTDGQTRCVSNAIATITYAIGGSGTNATLGGTLPAGVTGSYNAGVFTISGTPSVAGTFNYTVTPVGPCVNPVLGGSITVNDNGKIALITGSTTQTVCINTAIANITYQVSGAGTGATVSGLPGGVTGVYNSGTKVVTISGTPNVSGPFSYTVNVTGSLCINQSLGGSITVNPTPATPTAQPTNLILTPSGTTVVLGSFTAASPAPTGYLVIRTTTAAAPAPVPANGTTYTPGTAVLGGVIVSQGTGTTFAATGLTLGTPYWFWVYSYNSDVCAVTPKYLTASPLTNSTTTLACGVPTLYWAGSGSTLTGAGTGTDFNTAANWSYTPVTVTTSLNAPIACDNVNIALKATVTITLSAATTVNNFTATIQGNGNAGEIDVNGKALTVNGNTSMDAISGNKNTSMILLNADGNIFSAGPVISFLGNLVIGADINNLSAAPTNCPVVSISEDFFSNVSIGCRGNITLGKIASIGSGGNIFIPNYPPNNLYLDAAGTQSITWNNTVYYSHFANVIIGNTNSPTVNQVTGLVLPDNILGNLNINGTSVLNMGTSQWNRDASGGVFTMASNSKLLLSAGSSSPIGGAAPGGIVAPGSNFPGGFTTYTFGAGTTQEYNSVAAVNQTVYGPVNYGNLILTNATGSGNGTKNLTANIGAISTITVNPFVTFDLQTFTANRTVAAAGPFTLSANSTLKLSAGTGGQTGSNFPLNFTTINLNSGVSPTSTVEYYGTVAQTVYAVPTFYGNLTVSGASTKTAGAALTAKGDVTINTGAVFAGSTFNHSVGGNWINNVNTTAFTSTGTVTLNNGTVSQNIGGTSGTTFGSLNINNAPGVTISKDQIVNTQLTLTNGIVTIGTNNLTMGASAPAIAGTFSASRMILASNSGEVRKLYNATGNYFFPIGDNTGTVEYSPIAVNVTSGTFASGQIGVNVVDAKHPSNMSPTNFLTRYWNVTQSGITTCIAAVTGTYLPVDVSTTEAQISSAQLKGVFDQATNGWTKFQTLASNTLTVPTTTIASGLNAFTGISDVPPTVSITGGGITICKGSSVNLNTSVTGDPSFVYTWTSNTSALVAGLSSTTIANPTATPTATTTYTVQAKDINGVIATSSTTITVNDPVSITTAPPANTNTCNSGGIVITSTSTGTISQYQWQVSTDGFTYNDITGAPYSGYNTATLTITTPDVTMNEYLYRVVVKGTSPCGDQTSTSSRLTLKNIWTGNANTTDWNTATNWTGNTLPDPTCTTVYIPSRAFKPVLASGTTTVKSIIIYSGATLTIPSGSKLQVSNSITAPVASIFATSGTVEMNGSGIAQSISGSVFDGRTINQLINSNPAGLNVSNTLGDELKITGSLEFGSVSGSFIETGGNITLVSTAARTASVGKVLNGNSISGAASIERYLPAYKAWRFIAAPVKSATSPFITDAWREGGSTTSTGYGTQITGPASYVGIDAVTAAGSLKYYNDASGTFTPITNNNTTKISNKTGYMIYVRGDRATGVFGTSVNTNLRIKGEINTGDQAFSVKANSFQSIGNPYPAEISYDAIKLANPGLENSYRAWDASLNGSFNSGGYQTLSSVDGYQATASGSTFFPLGSLHPNIQSGQAFYVLNTTGTLISNMTISESMKVNGNTISVSRENSIADRQFIRAKLFTATGTIADGNLVAFDDEYTSDLDEFDALKFYNGGENIGILHSGKKLSVDARARVQTTDTIQYDITNLQVQNYKLVITATNFENGTVTAYLMDRFANTQTRLNLSDSNFVNVNVTSDAASKAANRLYIVFQKIQAPLPVTITNISASRNADRSIAVKWKVENELNMRRYEVQRSAEGSQFTSILSNDPIAVNGGSAAYNRDDLSPLATDNYYRIKAISTSGLVQYSAIVKVAPLKLNSDIGVYPNPVANKNVQIRFTDKVTGRYQVQITNKLGQTIYSGVAQVSGSVFTQSVQLDQNLAAGNYQLKVVSEDGTISTQQIIIQ